MAKVKNSASVSAEPRTPVKSNEDFLKIKYKPDKNYLAYAGISRDNRYLDMQNDIRIIGFDTKLTLIESNRNKGLFIPILPEIDRLIEVHGEEYKERLLSEMLDFDRIGSGAHYLEKEFNTVVNVNLDCIAKLHRTCFTDEECATIKSYWQGVGLLKLGRVKDGKKLLKKATENEFLHAEFLHAVITFKEIANHYLDPKSKPPRKKAIEEAIMSMIRLRKKFFPFPSFILGIMQAYNIISVINIASRDASKRACFEEILHGVSYRAGSYKCAFPPTYMMVNENEFKSHLKWIVQASKYELAKQMILCSEDLSYAKALLKELSVEKFVDAKCLYGLALLKNVFGDIPYFEKENFRQAYDHLEQAVNHGHREAMFFFGTLPFRDDFKYLEEEGQISKGRHCFECLGKYLETDGNAKDLKKAAAVFIAAEYVKERNSYVTYDEENAKYILQKNNCSSELQKLEHKLLERVKNILPDILSSLEQVGRELSKDCHSSAQHILSSIKELLIVLENSGLIVEETEILENTLKLLNIPSTETRIVILSLLMVLDELQSQLHKKPNYYSEKVLDLVRSLRSTVFDLHVECSKRFIASFQETRQNLNFIET